MKLQYFTLQVNGVPRNILILEEECETGAESPEHGSEGDVLLEEVAHRAHALLHRKDVRREKRRRPQDGCNRTRANTRQLHGSSSAKSTAS